MASYIAERAEKALELKNNGKLLRDIGVELGVSSERARQLVKLATRKRIHKNSEFHGLSTRVANCLNNENLYTKQDVRRFCKENDLRKIDCLGAKALTEIEVFLAVNP